MVSTQAKSVAMTALNCDQMDCDHVGPVRSVVGSIPAVRRTFYTVDAAVAWPRLKASRSCPAWCADVCLALTGAPRFWGALKLTSVKFRLTGGVV